MSELKIGMDKMDLSSLLVRILLTISASIVAFIIFNEIYFEVTGKALIG